ncbi:hypothetical protein FOMG_08642 [Fusarium oxysporum f. sp. melonis 26406]|uniref:Uncharacterized protein n=1 Tax=Fusarium oxysporum f. sp. melonis 26406 TaxID=1089452 RepID=X0A262_FUSOX|nr:hypothetical protein FOMG_08642 [Fusarium oxysporum f. sp. melonis 26406]
MKAATELGTMLARVAVSRQLRRKVSEIKSWRVGEDT